MVCSMEESMSTEKTNLLERMLVIENIAWSYIQPTDFKHISCIGPNYIDPSSGFCLCGCQGVYSKSDWLRKHQKETVTDIRQNFDTHTIVSTVELMKSNLFGTEFKEKIYVKRHQNGSILKMFLLGVIMVEVFTIVEYPEVKKS